MQNTMDARYQIAQFTDYLREYNKLTERCFGNCINNMNSRQLGTDEGSCVNTCASKYLHVNHKIMQIFQEIQPSMMEKRTADMEEQLRKSAEEKETLLAAEQPVTPIEPQVDTVQANQ